MIVKNLLLVSLLLLFAGCTTYQYTEVPEVEECRFLSDSIFCTHQEMNNARVNELISRAQSMDGLTDEQKEDIVNYFTDNRKEIISSKEFELDIYYHRFFRGYFLTNPTDETKIIDFMDEKLELLDKYINKYGRI